MNEEKIYQIFVGKRFLPYVCNAKINNANYPNRASSYAYEQRWAFFMPTRLLSWYQNDTSEIDGCLYSVILFCPLGKRISFGEHGIWQPFFCLNAKN